MWLVISNNFFSVRLQVSKQENTFRSKPRVINLPFVCKCTAGKCCVLSCSPDKPLLQRPQPTIRRPFHELSLRPFPWQQFQKSQHARVRSLRAFCEPLLLINGYMEFFSTSMTQACQEKILEVEIYLKFTEGENMFKAAVGFWVGNQWHLLVMVWITAMRANGGEGQEEENVRRQGGHGLRSKEWGKYTKRINVMGRLLYIAL